MADCDIATQKQEVLKWLGELYANEPIPKFEMNAKTVGNLHRKVLESRQKQRLITLVSENLRQKANEYNAEAQRLSGILSRLNFGPSNLTQSGSNSLRVLTMLASLLDVRDTSDTSYMLALQAMEDKLESLIDEKTAEITRLEGITNNYHALLRQRGAFDKATETTKHQVESSGKKNEQRKADTAFFQSKAKSYKAEIGKLQSQLTKMGVTSAVYHETLVEKSENLKALQKQLTPLTQELQSYSSLPPDLPQAKVAIEQQKRELAELEKMYAQSIDKSLL